MYRTHTCGALRIENVNENVCLSGWVQKIRNLGAMTFIDLRDRTGIVQLAFNDQTDRAIFEKAASCHSEYVLLRTGICDSNSR